MKRNSNSKHDQSQDGKGTQMYVEQDSLTEDMHPIKRPKSKRELAEDLAIQAALMDEDAINRANCKALGLE